MSKLDDRLPEMYAELHARAAFAGDTWRRYHKWLRGTFPDLADLRVLDFGCGPTGGLANTPAGGHVTPYDPYVPLYAADPWGREYDLFFSADVFEHLPEERALELLVRLRKRRDCRHLFIALATRPASKTLPNGLNVHLTVRPAEWWLGTVGGVLAQHYQFRTAKTDLLHGDAVFILERIDL